MLHVQIVKVGQAEPYPFARWKRTSTRQMFVLDKKQVAVQKMPHVERRGRFSGLRTAETYAETE